MSMKIPNVGRRSTPKRQNNGNAIAGLSPAMVAALKRLVAQQVTKQAEKKTQSYTSTISIGGYNYANFGINQVRTLTPVNSGGVSIAQGTGQGDRIGNRVKVTKATFKMTSWLQPYNAITNPTPTPVFLRVWFYYQKDTQAMVTSLPTFFQAGNTTQAPIGNVVDLNYDVNTDAFTVYRVETRKLGYAAFVASPGGLGPNGYYSNNDSEMSDLSSIDITPFYPKLIEWSDTNATPFSRPLYFWCEAVAQDGTTQTSGTAALQMNYQIILEYTDE